MAAWLCRLPIASSTRGQEILGNNEFIGSWQEPQKGQAMRTTTITMHCNGNQNRDDDYNSKFKRGVPNPNFKQTKYHKKL